MLKIQKINKKVNIILNEIKNSDILIVQKRWILTSLNTIFNSTILLHTFMNIASDIYSIYNVQVLKRKKRKGNLVKANLSNRGDSYLLITW